MRVVRDVAEMQALGLSWRGSPVGFVPTMGFLHRGHTALMSLTRPLCDTLVASIYVNPLQFSPTEDLSRYPRDPEGDAQKCQESGVDVLFMPEALYPPDFRTSVAVSGLTRRWEGAARPEHFAGVTTVVARLFGLVQPSVACFGEKDFQQLTVVRAMVRDLAMPLAILTGPLVRDDDGVALSSRNVYLTPEQRVRARSLNRALHSMRVGGTVAERLALAAQLIDADSVDYLALVDADTLEPLHPEARSPARAMVTARYGAVRLLDTMAV